LVKVFKEAHHGHKTSRTSWGLSLWRGALCCVRGANAITWDGKPREYESSPGKYRGFCPTCGSSITWCKGDDDSFIDFRLGTFDDPRPFKAKKHLWMSSALPSFAVIDPEIEHFD